MVNKFATVIIAQFGVEVFGCATCCFACTLKPFAPDVSGDAPEDNITFLPAPAVPHVEHKAGNDIFFASLCGIMLFAMYDLQVIVTERFQFFEQLAELRLFGRCRRSNYPGVVSRAMLSHLHVGSNHATTFAPRQGKEKGR